MTMLTIDRPALVLALVRVFGRAGRLAPFARRKQAPSDRFNFYVRPSSGKPAEASYSYARVRKNWRNALVTLEGNGKKTKQNKAPADLNKYFFFFPVLTLLISSRPTATGRCTSEAMCSIYRNRGPKSQALVCRLRND